MAQQGTCMGLVPLAVRGVGKKRRRVRVHDAFLFLLYFFNGWSFPTLERGSLVETNKNWSGKLAKSLGSLKSAGGERRWELQGEASMALQNRKTALSLCCASEVFPPLISWVHRSRPQSSLHCYRALGWLCVSPAGSCVVPTDCWHPQGCNGCSL